jgi:predicted KAP-like P-loop ATPase
MRFRPADLLDTLAVCDRLAPILATAPTINGNPRTIKRLLNAITLRQTLSADRKMNVGLATLAKLAVFERSTDSRASQKLYQLVMVGDANAATAQMTSDEKLKGKRPELPSEWKGHEAFINRWRDMEPHFDDAKDLRPALFLSRDVMAPSYARSGLSDAAKQAIEALTATTSVNSPAASKTAKALGIVDKRLVMGELVAHLRKQDWTKSPLGVHGAIILAKESPEAEEDLKAFLATLQLATMHKATKFLLEKDKLIAGAR